MLKVLRLTGTRGLLLNEKKIKESERKVKDVTMDILCYLDLYYDGKFRYIVNGKEIKDYDLFWIGGTKGLSMKQGFSYYFGHLKKKKFVDKFSLYKLDNTKFCQLLFAHHYGFRVPESIFFVIENIYMNRYIEILEKKLVYPFIAKDVGKDRGEGVFLIKKKEDIIKLFKKNELHGFILQEYIKNDGDIRVVVAGKQIIGTIKRYNPHSFKNNISLGGIGEEFKIKKSFKKLCIDITKKYGLGISGLDFFVNGNNYYLIEINDLPQHSGLEKYTKVNFYKEVLNYFASLG